MQNVFVGKNIVKPLQAGYRWHGWTRARADVYPASRYVALADGHGVRDPQIPPHPRPASG